VAWVVVILGADAAVLGAGVDAVGLVDVDAVGLAVVADSCCKIGANNRLVV